MKMGNKLVIAVDFDGTLVEHKYPAIGEQIPDAFETLRKLKKDGHTLILWTCREGTELKEAIDYCLDRGVFFDGHNETLFFQSRKVLANIYIDDRNLGGLPNWNEIYKMISKRD